MYTEVGLMQCGNVKTKLVPCFGIWETEIRVRLGHMGRALMMRLLPK